MTVPLLASPFATAAPLASVADAVAPHPTIGTPLLWAGTLVAVLVVVVLDFLVTHKPHEVSMREAVKWSIIYIALPLLFGVWVIAAHDSTTGIEYYTGYLVEKSLSVDNLFVFMLLLAAFAVPRELQQRVLLIGVVGALALRGVFIALGAEMLQRFDWTFLLFGLILVATAVKVLRDAIDGDENEVDPDQLRSVRIIRKFWPVTNSYRGTKFSVREHGRRAVTPLLLVVIAVMSTDVVFAVDSVPAVYGITGDPYLVFVTNAFALMGLRALYFVLEGALSRLVHLGYGLAAILFFIGAKLALHWAHGIWPATPEIPTLASLGVIVGILGVVTATSLWVTRRGVGVDKGVHLGG
ncbi:TerC family protein [Demequina sp.]|uniref:TerC family protein n=1 Tax=Demequina sp. TaxID=2050685 RepID=UPI0025C5A4A5|nr:TerC family protein [Demequina sp.]